MSNEAVANGWFMLKQGKLILLDDSCCEGASGDDTDENNL